MRLWTVHPRYLDVKGLLAAWREGLLAQKVLRGETRGYRHHPQLQRFRAARSPRQAISTYLHALAAEARQRGYHFDESKIAGRRSRVTLPETRGQLQYEWSHLLKKLRVRAPALARSWSNTRRPEPHPLFRLVAGPVRDWEKRIETATQMPPRTTPRRPRPAA